jgi:hypothetical protein
MPLTQVLGLWIARTSKQASKSYRGTHSSPSLSSAFSKLITEVDSSTHIPALAMIREINHGDSPSKRSLITEISSNNITDGKSHSRSDSIIDNIDVHEADETDGLDTMLPGKCFRALGSFVSCSVHLPCQR